MHKYFVLICILLLPLIEVQAASESLNTITVKQHILPAYKRLADSTLALKQQAMSYCENPTPEAQNQLKAKHIQAMYDWQSIQHIRFGPVDYLLRYNRFQMWPDKRGTVGKHLNRIIAKEDLSQLEAERFAQSSVAIQGFSALERLLFTDKEHSGFECALISTIANNLNMMTRGIIRDWNEPPASYLENIITANDGNDFFESDREVSSRLLNNLYTQLQMIVDLKLANPLGSSLQKARGKRAESWRSAQSLRHIQLNLEASRALYEMAFAPVVEDEALRQAINAAYANAYKKSQLLSLPLHTAVKNKEERKKVEVLRQAISELKALIAQKLSPAIDVPLGFNSLDGD
jgi:hypothetical protein